MLDVTTSDSADATADGGEAEAGSDASGDGSAIEGSTDGGSDSGDAASGEADAGPPLPVALVSDAPNARLIASDGANVYWVDWVAGDAGQQIGRVMKVSVAGGNETALASTPDAIPVGLALDSTNVYWTDSANELWQVSKSGGAPTSLQSGAGTPVAAVGGFVYFSPTTAGGVERVPTDGGNVTTVASTGAPVDLVVVASDVFWADATGQIVFAPAAGGTATALVSPDPDAGAGEYVSTTPLQNLTTDGTSLYWPRQPNGYPGAVMSLPISGGAPQVVVNVASSIPLSVATDGTNVYFLGVGASTTLAAAPVSGGTPIDVATTDLSAANITGSPGPTVAVDSSNLYWLNPPQILKLAK
jgi:hypothetical protein